MSSLPMSYLFSEKKKDYKQHLFISSSFIYSPPSSIYLFLYFGPPFPFFFKPVSLDLIIYSDSLCPKFYVVRNYEVIAVLCFFSHILFNVRGQADFFYSAWQYIFILWNISVFCFISSIHLLCLFSTVSSHVTSPKHLTCFQM